MAVMIKYPINFPTLFPLFAWNPKVSLPKLTKKTIIRIITSPAIVLVVYANELYFKMNRNSSNTIRGIV